MNYFINDNSSLIAFFNRCSGETSAKRLSTNGAQEARSVAHSWKFVLKKNLPRNISVCLSMSKTAFSFSAPKLHKIPRACNSKWPTRESFVNFATRLQALPQTKPAEAILSDVSADILLCGE